MDPFLLSPLSFCPSRFFNSFCSGEKLFEESWSNNFLFNRRFNDTRSLCLNQPVLEQFSALTLSVEISSRRPLPGLIIASELCHLILFNCFLQTNYSDAGLNRFVRREFFPFTGYVNLPFDTIKPSVFMTGFSWGHLTDLNLTDFRIRVLNSTFVSKIRTDLLPLKNSIRIFETNSYSTTSNLRLENYQRRNVILREIFVNQLHFEELDQYQLTAAKFDSRDGFHYAGVPRAMSVIISLNLMCKSRP
jgi:hypothetical protein